MDILEATNVLFSKIKMMEPELASKIMGFLLIQDLHERDVIRLAFGPETVLRTVIFKAKSQLGLSSNALSTPSSPSPLNPISRPNVSNPFSLSSPRVPVPPSPPSNSTISPKASPFLSYDNIRAASLPNTTDFGGDEIQLNEHLSFLNESTSAARNEEFVDPRVQFGDFSNVDSTHLHRRSFSASDACVGDPCAYHTRGACRDGEGCKFMHNGLGDVLESNGGLVDSPRKIENPYLLHQQEAMMIKMKAAQQRRLAAEFAAGGMSPLAYNKSLNFLLQQQYDSPRLGVASRITDDDLHKLGCFRPERSDFLTGSSSASRQIYLTFPADSTFRDEDVSNYFSNFGPVQDVRIPYQQKRMFGFVTFLYPETVSHILERGNPHFICESRVLVKPYKEKGKMHDKRLQQFERSSISPSSCFSGNESAELYELDHRAKIFYTAQELMLRRKLEEQAELQRAIEFEERRLMNLQLPDFKGDLIRQRQRSLSVGAPVSLTHTDGLNNEFPEGNGGIAAATISYAENAAATTEKVAGDGRTENFNNEVSDERERSGLPKNFFASPSPRTLTSDRQSDFSTTNHLSPATTSYANVVSHQ